MSLKWTAERLRMGSWTYISNLLHGMHRTAPAAPQSRPQGVTGRTQWQGSYGDFRLPSRILARSPP
jgi:hypothetical protein